MGSVALLAVNTDRGAPRDITLRTRSERYTLSSEEGLLSHRVELNGKALGLEDDGAMPPIHGVPQPAGQVSLPAASVTFLAIAEAGNNSCDF